MGLREKHSKEDYELAASRASLRFRTDISLTWLAAQKRIKSRAPRP